MGIKAVSDAGPIIHLAELSAIKALKIADTATTIIVMEELDKYKIRSSLKIIKADNNKTAFFADKYNIGLGEASCISVCINERIQLIFTDDLDARMAAKKEGLEPHGTVGILLKAYKHKIFTKNQILEILHSIKEKSTLFITQILINQAITALKNH